jgi:hypothetical protein
MGEVMAQPVDDGNAAFSIPGLVTGNGDFIHPWPGMTLRDYFAAHCPITFTEFLKGWKRTGETNTDDAFQRFAEFRHQYADAMLAARKPKEETNAE